MKKSYLVLLYICIIMLIVLPLSTLAESVNVTDLSGATVVIPANISRVVTVDPFTNQFFFIIGSENKLVGTCIGPANRSLVNSTEPFIAKLPSVGCKTKVNLDLLKSLKPDLVISDVSYTQMNKDIYENGIPVVLVDVESPTNLIKSYQLIGKILGKENETSNFISYYNQKMELIHKNVPNIEDKDKIKIYFGQNDPLRTFGGDYYESDITSLAGGKNVAEGLSKGDNKISIDQIYNWNPDLIILLPYSSTNVTDLLKDSIWQSLPAIQEKKVYRMPKYLMSWELPVPESILGTMWLQKVMYPDKDSINLSEEIKEFYSKFYRLNLSDNQINEILNDPSQAIHYNHY